MPFSATKTRHWLRTYTSSKNTVYGGWWRYCWWKTGKRFT